MQDRTAIFVLGMHRSGTSALTRVLSLLGASLPRDVYPPGPGNETGHWEPEAAVGLHDRMLEAAGTSVNAPHGPADAWFGSQSAGAFLGEMKDLVAAQFRDAPLFVFKDPRASLLFPLWRRALDDLGIRCVAALTVRNPIEVALSLGDRQTRARPEQIWPIERGGLLWLRYMLAAERHARNLARGFCAYPALLADWRGTVDRLADDLGLVWPRSPAEAARDIDAFLSTGLRHQQEPDDLSARAGVWSSWIAPVYAALSDAAAGGGVAHPVFDAVRRSFDAAYGEIAAAAAPTPAPFGRAGMTRLCLVGSAFRTVGDGGHLGAIVEAADAAGIGITLLDPAGHPEQPGLPEAIAATGRLEIDYCAAGTAAIEPGFLRPTVELFRRLRDRRFDAILFQDREALAFASVIAKQAGIAFGDTLLGVVAFGGSRRRRQAAGEFPSGLVAIATDHIEQQAAERSDVVIMPSADVAAWMRQAGWRLENTLPLCDSGALAGDENAWRAVLRQLPPAKRRDVDGALNGAGTGDVAIVIPHYERPRLLDQTLQSLTRQTDADFSVVVVDDGSASADAQLYLDTVEERYRSLRLRLLRQDNRYLGAARNAGIRATNAAFIILLDDDNIAFPEMVAVLRRAILRSDADVVTCGIRRFHDPDEPPSLEADWGPDQFFSAGPILLGAVHNCFGDASGIYRRSVFETVGYFHERHGVTFEDWQMHLRVVTAGLRLISLPEPLVWYRLRAGSMLQTTRRYENARVIAETVAQLPCGMLEPLADYLMGTEADQVRLNEEIVRLNRLLA